MCFYILEDHGVVVMTEVWKNSSEEPAPVDALLLLKPGVKGLPHHVKGHLYLIGVNDWEGHAHDQDLQGHGHAAEAEGNHYYIQID